MATYTPNYRLHQWEPEDKFLRTDFNEDFAALDTALGRTARQGADTAYNLYDLFLRAGLEERAGGSQRAVLYDGFSDGEGMAGRDAPLLLRDGALRLFRTGESGWTAAPGGSYQTPYHSALGTLPHTAQGAGRFTGCRFPIKNTSTAEKVLRCFRNQEVLWEQKLTIPAHTGSWEVTFDTPVDLLPGDSCYLYMDKGGSSSLSFALSDRNNLAVTALVTPLGAEEGSASAPPVTPPEGCRTATLYVRYDGGGVAPQLNGRDMVHRARRATREPGGAPCTEDMWTAELDGSGAQTLSWTLQSGETACALYDYGLIFF